MREHGISRCAMHVLIDAFKIEVSALADRIIGLKHPRIPSRRRAVIGAMRVGIRARYAQRRRERVLYVRFVVVEAERATQASGGRVASTEVSAGSEREDTRRV